MTTQQNSISLKDLHTFQLPYRAAEVITIHAREELEEIEGDYLVLGEGSNTIFTCDFQRPILRVALDEITIQESSDHYQLSVGAGVNWHELVVFTLENDMPGLENLALIPGSVGAAPVQNIGAYGVEVGDYIDSVTAWDRIAKEWRVFSREACAFAYRDSHFKRNPHRFVISEVNFKLPKAWQPRLGYGALAHLSDNATAQEVMQAVIAIRNSKLPNPNVTPNAGSFFKNPEVSSREFERIKKNYPQVVAYQLPNGNVKLAAGWLIDQLGLKGFNCGGAAVHRQQALVLINQGGAQGNDILNLARHVRAQVLQRFGVELEAEVRLMDKKGLIEL